MSTAVLALMLATSTLAQPYDFHFAPKPGAQAKMALRAELNDLQVSGTSMGITGSLQATVLLKVLSPVEGDKNTRLQIDIKDLKVMLNGAEQSPPAVPTTLLEIDGRGRVVSLQCAGNVGAADLMSTAGMPANLLAVALLTTRFADKPVSPGDDWTAADTYPTPFGVTAQATFTGKLDSVANGNAVLTNDVAAALPDFQTANPMEQGTQMTVKDCKLNAQLPCQLVSLDTGMVSQAYGTLAIDLQAEMAGMDLPANISIFVAAGADDATAQKLLAEAKQPQTPVAAKPGATPAAAATQVLQVSSADFADKVLHSTKPVLVNFYAEWCGPCKQENPIIDSLAQTYGAKMTFARVNVDDCQDLARKYGVEAIPTLVIFSGGKPTWRKVGLTSQADLKTGIDKALAGK